MLSRALESIKFRNNQKHDENQYIALIDDIINHGDMVDGRNGKTLTVFGSSMHFSLENGELPLLTTKKVAWKTCLKELLWFINGDTSNKKLNDFLSNFLRLNTEQQRASPSARDIVVEVVGIVCNLSASE